MPVHERRIEKVKRVTLTTLCASAPLREFLLFLCLLCAGLHAEVTMPAIFGDHMVLQQGTTLPVWGFAAPGEHVSVSYEGRQGEAVADASGEWRVTLRPLPYSKSPGNMVINGSNRIEFRDVIVGDVWVCAGEGNMAFPLSEATGGKQAAAITDRGLRCFTPVSRVSSRPGSKGSGGWVVCDPETAPSFPAVAFFFARDLRASRHIPVGIVNCSTPDPAPITTWMSPRAAQGIAGMRGNTRTPPAAHFNGMIAPIIPYAITGAIWYQGESDEGRGAIPYRILLPRLIRDWREKWKQGPFPFFAVSQAGFGAEEGPAVEPMYSDDGSPRRALPWLREGIASITTLPFTGVAVATDLGLPDDRHPPDKLDLGRRLALLARHRVYGEEIPDSGPLFRSMKIEGNKVRVVFESQGRGLATGISPAMVEGANGMGTRVTTSLRGFAVAGENRKWFPATARIDGNDVILSSDAVPHPVEVRYNWRGFPVGNLYNKAGLPAPPFRSDRDQPE
jgi:sialate O-acetylesterase